MHTFRLERGQTGVLLVDVQDKLLPHVDRSCEVLISMIRALEGFKLFDLPIVVSEQYPQGLGKTVAPLRQSLPKAQTYWPKTSFSCLDEPRLREHIKQQPVTSWIVMGLETHVCVLQTVFDLIALGKNVMLLNDATTSRSVFDFSTAIAEMRDAGARIGSVEIALYELLRDAKEPPFKALNELIKKSSVPSNCCMAAHDGE